VITSDIGQGRGKKVHIKSFKLSPILLHS